ncbi:hypothetical protein GCM10008905_06450 [Clostridium malenominatum]|uniref:Uncharacterized protein n=1 Tax=Clostridium malenominatum TaxID=1539 RepID=A0ABP3TZK9_9CLOT
MGKFKLSMNIALDIIMDSETGDVEVIGCASKISNTEKVVVNQWQRHILTAGESKYGYIKVSSKSTIGRLLPLGEAIKVKFIKNDAIDERLLNSHKSIKGRLDGCTKPFAVNGIYSDTELLMKYLVEDKILEVKIDN